MAADESNDDKTRSFIALTSGTVVLHYKILDKIGSGGMGEVYLALDTKLNRKVALKFLPPPFCQDEDCRKRFIREAQAAAALDHPSIAAIYEVGEFSGRPFYAMQMIEGQSLKQAIADRDLPIDRILEIGIQVGEGLQAAHEKGIIHRDIKPSNILLDDHDRARIVDFGLAAMRGSEQLTKTGATFGTVGYMSPEQVQGREIDARSDLFSLGVVLYELITRHNPFQRDSEAATLKAVCDDAVEPIARYKRDVPELLGSIIDKMLEKNPEHRYQAASGTVSDLKRLMRDSGSKMSIGSTTMRKSNWLRIALIFIAVAVLAAVFILKPWQVEISSTQEAIAADNRLAVLYFENIHDPDDSLKLGEIVTSLLITDLSESRYTDIVSSQRLYDILKQLGHEGEKRIDRSVASQVGEKAKARWMLLGSILNTEPDIVIAAQIVEIATGNVLASQRIEGQPNERIFSVVDHLSRAIREDLSLSSEADSEVDLSVAEMTTNSPEAYRLYIEALDLFYKHIWADAEVLFLKAIEIDSAFAMAHFQLAQIDYWRNDSQAHEHIANAIRYSESASHKGKLYINSLDARLRSDIPKSIEYLERLIENYPDDKNPYISLGLLLVFETRQLKEAVNYFEKALDLDPFHREALNQLAYAYNGLGRFDKAIWAINKYVEIAPEEANAYDSRGEILSMNGRLDDAIASYEQSIQLDPDFSRFRLADLYLYRGNVAAADSLFRAAAADESERVRAEGRLALTSMPRYQGRFNEAFRLMEVGIAMDRMELGNGIQVAGKLFARALIYDFLGKPESVVENLREAVLIIEESEARTLYVGLFKAYLAAELTASGNQPAADSLMSEITETITASGYPDSSFYWIASGLTHFKLRQYDKAAGFWEKVLAPVPHHFPSLMYLGMSYLGAGQLGNAVAALEKANNVYSESRGGTPDMGVLCHYHLGRAYEESGWIDKAISQYEEFLEIWKNADPGIKETEDARMRLAGLRSGS